MTEILKQLENASELDNQATEFRKLSKNKKIELLEELKKLKHDKTGKFLNLIYPDEEDKEIRKRIRLLLHKLKSTGIRIEEPRISGSSVLKKIEEKKDHKGFMSNFDDFNTRIVMTAFQIRKNNYIFLNGTVRFADGLVDLLTVPVDRNGLRDVVNEYRFRTGIDMVFVDVSPGYSFYVLEEASKISGKFTEEIAQARKILSREQYSIQKPADIYSLEIPETAHSMEVERILEHAIFEPFKLTWPTIEEDKKAFSNTGGSAIVLPPYMVEEKRQSFLKALLEKDDLKSVVPHIKRMLEDYAYIFYCLKELPYYKGLIDYLCGSGESLNPAMYFMSKSLEAENNKADGLIVNPYG